MFTTTTDLGVGVGTTGDGITIGTDLGDGMLDGITGAGTLAGTLGDGITGVGIIGAGVAITAHHTTDIMVHITVAVIMPSIMDTEDLLITDGEIEAVIMLLTLEIETLT